MSTTANCADCRYFINSPAALESLLPGMNTLGSAFGSVRDSDGLCERHQRYLRATCRCSEHERRTSRSPAATQ
jgi:hypothetical protein